MSTSSRHGNVLLIAPISVVEKVLCMCGFVFHIWVDEGVEREIKIRYLAACGIQYTYPMSNKWKMILWNFPIKFVHISSECSDLNLTINFNNKGAQPWAKAPPF